MISPCVTLWALVINSHLPQVSEGPEESHNEPCVCAHSLLLLRVDCVMLSHPLVHVRYQLVLEALLSLAVLWVLYPSAYRPKMNADEGVRSIWLLPVAVMKNAPS